MDFLYFLGRFHVLVLHLPIGIICALFVLEWLARKEKYRYLEAASPFLWGAMALTALVTVTLGYLHLSEGNFGSSGLQHRNFGTAVALIATVVALLRTSSFAASYKPRLLSGVGGAAAARCDHGAFRRQPDARLDVSRRICAATAARARGSRVRGA